jgi:crotonobetainyl-CoA:carnitine CoA-transferase CaiB-like acyl-CoA transferase
MSELPLAGMRVLDLSRLVAGNMLTMVLADFGADVIKVEQPGAGDPLRAWKSGGLDLWWRVYGRNKRSITLNLAQPAGRDLLLRLLPKADLFVENFIPGTLEEWGLGPEALLRRNRGLVVVRISGWGQEGPYRHRPGFGTFVEAMSGFAAMTGPADAPPTLPPLPLADMSAALYGAAAALIALRHRDASGEGQVIDLSLLEPLFSLLGPLAAEYRLIGQVRERIGNRSYNSAPRNTYRTSDGEWVAISASTPAMATRFFQAIGRADLLENERFATNEERVRHVEELDQHVAAEIARFTLPELLERFETHRVGAAPVYDISQLLEDPHVRARRMVVEVPQDGGAGAAGGVTPMHDVIPRLLATPGRIRWPGPALGGHNEEVYLGELSLPEVEFLRLRGEGIV